MRLIRLLIAVSAFALPSRDTAFLDAVMQGASLSEPERRFYREVRRRIRKQLERARLTPEEAEEKREHYGVGGTTLTSNPRPGLLVQQLWNRILGIDPAFGDYYTFATFRNLLTPGYAYRLPLWVIHLVALALEIPPIALLPVDDPGEPLPGTALYRQSGRPPSELEEVLVEASVQIASLRADRPDLAEGLLQQLRNASFEVAYAAQTSPPRV